MIRASVVRVEVEFGPFIQHHRPETVAAGADLELADALGTGAYGAVHPIAQIGGAAPAAKLVAKLFDPAELAAAGGPTPIIDSVSALHDGLSRSGDTDWADAFKALPYQFIVVRINNREQFAALMLDLAALGYRGAPFTEDKELRTYRKLTLDVRTALAVKLAERFDLLAQVAFVHGDLNPENVMWNPQTGDVQIIDFDSGTVIRSAADRPRTVGKQDACMPPEVQDPQAPGGVDATQFTPVSERWSYASLIGYFLFSVHPAFFLSEISPTSIEAYAKAPERWPDIDQRGPLFTGIAQSQRAYTKVLQIFASIPCEVTDLFAAVFNAGLDAGARPTAGEWLAALEGLSTPPTVEVILLTDDIVLEGDDVVIAWRGKNATHVDLAPGGRQPASGSLSYVAKDHFRVTVTASNAFGSVTVEGPIVRVMPLPRLERVTVPSFPGFELPLLSVSEHAHRRHPGAAVEPAMPASPVLARGLGRRTRRSEPQLPAYPPAPRFPGLMAREIREAARTRR